jgi:glycosyltransferase involved in cell wall biosynthesis
MIRCSVVIPTYNRSESLMRTLESLSLQTVPTADFEVVVVSDGSTDDTSRKLADFQKNSELNLVIVEQPNSGPAAARNNGVSTAKSDVIVFTDDDVEPVRVFLERHIAHHETADNIVVLGPLSPNPKWQSSEPVWIAWEHEQLQSIYNMFKPGGDFAGSYAGFEHFYSGNASLRKHWLVDSGGFSTNLRRQEDTELAARMKMLGELFLIWDFDADGLHHPVRSLDSWLRIPGAYGEVDAQRVISGGLDAEFIASNDKKRHKATKVLDSICDKLPGLTQPMSQILCAAATFIYKLGRKKPAFAILSGVYNVLYMQAYKKTTNSLRPVPSANAAKAS